MSVSKGLRAVARSPSAQKGLTAEMLVEAGYPAAGTETGESFARKLSAVDRCIEILSDSMGKLPCFIMDSRSWSGWPCPSSSCSTCGPMRP